MEYAKKERNTKLRLRSQKTTSEMLKRGLTPPPRKYVLLLSHEIYSTMCPRAQGGSPVKAHTSILKKPQVFYKMIDEGRIKLAKNIESIGGQDVTLTVRHLIATLHFSPEFRFLAGRSSTRELVKRSVICGFNALIQRTALLCRVTQSFTVLGIGSSSLSSSLDSFPACVR